MANYERTLDDILCNWHPPSVWSSNNPEFHGRREFEKLMMDNHGFHDKNNTWIVKTETYLYILRVWYKAETSMFPQSENNEVGIIEYCFKFPIESFASALQIMTKQNYEDILKMLKG